MSEGATGVFTCSVCGKQYRMCRKCTHSKVPYVAWRATACSPECYEVSEVVNAHAYGRIDSQEAVKRLEAVGWRNIEHMLPDVHEYIDKVMKETAGRKPKTAKKDTQSVAADE